MKDNPLDWLRNVIYARDDYELLEVWFIGGIIGLGLGGLLLVILSN